MRNCLTNITAALNHIALSDWLTIIAILFGPIVAVWLTRKIDDIRLARDLRMNVFRALMRTRRLRLSPEHVTALNLVEIEFYKERDVIGAWKNYWICLNKIIPNDISESELNVHSQEKERLLAKLLDTMAKSLKLQIEQLELLQGGYAPQGWASIEQQQRVMRSLLIDVLKGNLPIRVTTGIPPMPKYPYPLPPEALNNSGAKNDRQYAINLTPYAAVDSPM